LRCIPDHQEDAFAERHDENHRSRPRPQGVAVVRHSPSGNGSSSPVENPRSKRQPGRRTWRLFEQRLGVAAGRSPGVLLVLSSTGRSLRA
jgi:hypothetical protein